jgi:RimJ/RimL family protein N-acetyltransferase
MAAHTTSGWAEVPVAEAVPQASEVRRQYSFTFQPSRDFILIGGILTHQKLWPMLVDDFAEIENFVPQDHPAILYLVARDAGELLGLFMLVQMSGVMWEVHTCLLPNAWGQRALAVAKAMLAWFWEATGAKRLITSVPEDNVLALRFAKRAGLKPFGINEKSFQRGGKLLDQYMLGINREDQPSPCTTR